MDTVAIITSMYGKYDSLKPVCAQAGVEVDWVVVTDDDALPADVVNTGWRVIYLPRPNEHPNRSAKAAKLKPWEFTHSPASIWIDASFRVTSPEFAKAVLSYSLPLAQFTHPDRDCIFKEAVASLAGPKYRGEPIIQQAATYSKSGHPAKWGLWSAGVIARRHTADMKLLGQRWQEEITKWSFQDQISQPYVMRCIGVRPHTIPGLHCDNLWISYEPSSKH